MKNYNGSIEQIKINHKATEGSSEQDLLDAIKQFNDEANKEDECNCVKNGTIINFNTIDGGFCKGCGFVYPF